ncbi:MAG: epoxyqueuosine reductase QueH [Candidatus Omnitrophota bacterium]
MNILLHICCGVCAGASAERLMCEGHKVTGFFYNPNIHPADEYQKRLEGARKVAERLNFELVEGVYNREKWFGEAKGNEYEPEGGKRCAICFRMRLLKTYEYLKKKMFSAFTTTLTMSPLKDVTLVNSIGREIGGEKFILIDFKKKGGFARAAELAKEGNLYRQNYCGCIYSLEEKYKK